MMKEGMARRNRAEEWWTGEGEEMIEEGEEEEEEEHQLTFVTIVGRRDIGEGFVHRTNVTSAADEDIYRTSEILAT